MTDPLCMIRDVLTLAAADGLGGPAAIPRGPADRRIYRMLSHIRQTSLARDLRFEADGVPSLTLTVSNGRIAGHSADRVEALTASLTALARAPGAIRFTVTRPAIPPEATSVGLSSDRLAEALNCAADGDIRPLNATDFTTTPLPPNASLRLTEGDILVRGNDLATGSLEVHHCSGEETAGWAADAADVHRWLGARTG